MKKLEENELENFELIERGRGSKVYRDNSSGNVLKIFKPSLFTTTTCKVFGGVNFPYSESKDAVECAKEKRQILNKISSYLFNEKRFANSIESLELDETYGLELEYIGGKEPKSKKERKNAREFAHETYCSLKEIGITSLDLNKFFPKSTKDIRILENGKYKILDCEPSCFHPSFSEMITYDGVEIEKLEEWMDKKENNMLKKFDSNWFEELDKNIKKYKKHSQRWREEYPTFGYRASTLESKYEDKIFRPIKDGTERLYEEEEITEEEFERYKEKRDIYKEYIKGFTSHLAISLATPTGIGAPASSIMKPLATLTQRKLSGDKKIHSLWVAGLSSVPMAGAFLGYPPSFLIHEGKDFWNLLKIAKDQYRYEKDN